MYLPLPPSPKMAYLPNFTFRSARIPRDFIRRLRQRAPRRGVDEGLVFMAGAAGGVALANALFGAFLRDAFAGLIVIVAAQLVHRTLHFPKPPADGANAGP